MKCIFCKKTMIGYGNNAEPVSSGKCCGICNDMFVIPCRLNPSLIPEVRQMLCIKHEPEVGDYIKIIRMEGEPRYSGKTGRITLIDDMGQLHGTWGGLAVQPENDKIEVIMKSK